MKRKNEEVENEKVKVSKIKLLRMNYKENPAFRALVKLLLYFIFFAVIISVVAFNDIPSESNLKDTTKNPAEEVVEPKNYKDMLNETVLNNNFFKYEININGEIKILEYTILNNNFNGTLETSNGVTKFEFKDNNFYEIRFNEEIQNNELFNGLNLEYINIYSLISLVSNSKALKMINDDKTVYNYTIDASIISVTTNEEKIEKIEITEENSIYSILV
ncbi:MAG: hypothetical protein J1F35_00135 [Erysipelotrichales bacterium]|nr:hypothetical protein [Erysipelotrichales bacterium]